MYEDITFMHLRCCEDCSELHLTWERQPKYFNTKGGVTIATKVGDDGNLYFGFAVCSPVDVYSKAIGRQLSANRLYQNMADGITIDIPSSLYEYYSYDMYSPLTAFIGNMILRHGRGL